jgi:hypothetical protein
MVAQRKVARGACLAAPAEMAHPLAWNRQASGRLRDAVRQGRISNAGNSVTPH